MNGKLSDYIEKVKKKKKTPNITKLAEATIPKGRGRKGSEDPRKRKRNSTVETHLENPSLIHVQLLTGSPSPLPKTYQLPPTNFSPNNYCQRPPYIYQPETVWSPTQQN